MLNESGSIASEKNDGDIARHDRIIGEILARLNQVEIILTRQQLIIDQAVAASEGSVGL